jgi:molybdenum cofactor cytidylyltransferase
MSDFSQPDLYAVVLAGGPSTRFGSPKALIQLAGTPVLHWAVSNAARAGGTSVGVVLGADAGAIAPMLRRSGASIVVNRGWQEGLASSVRAAVNAAPPGCEGLLLTLVDQVAVTADDLRRLTLAWKRHPVLIAAALYNGAPGLPALFPSWAFADLLGLRGESDPKVVIRRHSDRVVRVAMPSAAVDVNTPEDLLEISSRGPNRTES